jgi:division protein CdvB (Snf7/Vps24/ESCRT-III family)
LAYSQGAKGSGRRKKLRNLLHSEPPPFCETVARSVQTLKVQRNKIQQASYRLRERDRILFQTCINALNNKNRERAAICANEVAEVRKLLQFLYNVELAIERVILRLETIKELSDVVTDLKPALRLLQSVSQELFNLLPDVSSELSEVQEAISETLYSTKITTDESIIQAGKKTPGGEEILKEVTGLLERKLAEKLPEPPATLKTPETEKNTLKEMVALTATCSKMIGQKFTEDSETDSSQTLFSFKKAEIKEISLMVEKPSLEDILLDYVKRSNGEIDLSRCSVDLKASNEEIQKALDSLGNKGRIKIELQTSG